MPGRTKDVQRKKAQCDLITKSLQKMNFSVCTKPSATLFDHFEQNQSISHRRDINQCTKLFSIIMLKEEKNHRRKPSLAQSCILKSGCATRSTQNKWEGHCNTPRNWNRHPPSTTIFQTAGRKKTMNDISCKSFLWEHSTKDIKNAYLQCTGPCKGRQ